MECLDNIIGIIETPTTELPNITTSDSGLWLEDTSAGRVPVKEAFYNDQSLIDTIIPDAVKEALLQLRKISDNKMLRMYTNQHSTIGFSKDFTDHLEASGEYYYLGLGYKGVKGAIMRLKEINIYTINGLHTGQIEIYKGDVEIYSGLQSAFSEITIDLDDTVFICYQGDRPRNFEHTGCCGARPTHQGYVNATSGTVADLVSFPTFQDLPISNYCNGIEVKCTFDCDPFSFLCGLDYVRSTFGVVFAKLVQQIARKNIIYWLKTNNKVGSYATCKEDALNMIMEYLIDDIETMLNYLPENYDHSDCYYCNGIYKGEIII